MTTTRRPASREARPDERAHACVRRAGTGTDRATARDVGRRRGRGEWQRDQPEEQHQEFRVAEVVLEQSGARASRRWRPGRAPASGARRPATQLADKTDRGRHDEHEPQRRAPAVRARRRVCTGTLCRCGVSLGCPRDRRRRRLVLRDVDLRHHLRPDAEQRMVARSSPRRLAASRRDRGWSRRSDRRSDIARLRMPAGADEHEQHDDHRQRAASSFQSAQRQQRHDGQHGADPRVARLA